MAVGVPPTPNLDVATPVLKDSGGKTKAGAMQTHPMCIGSTCLYDQSKLEKQKRPVLNTLASNWVGGAHMIPPPFKLNEGLKAWKAALEAPAKQEEEEKTDK